MLSEYGTWDQVDGDDGPYRYIPNRRYEVRCVDGDPHVFVLVNRLTSETLRLSQDRLYLVLGEATDLIEARELGRTAQP
jgi:hypothetical protein